MPSLVIFIEKEYTTQMNEWGYQHELWVKYTPGHAVVSLSCPNDINVHRGIFNNLKASLGPVDDVCNMKNRPIRIAHNMLPPFFAVKNGAIDPTSLESTCLQSFLERYNLTPSFYFAKQVWGIKNKSSGKWNGITGSVGHFVRIF